MSELYDRLEKISINQKTSKLKLNFETLHSGYTANNGLGEKYIKSIDDAICYAFYRMPSTTAVIKKCFSYIPRSEEAYSVLDLGAGTGASVFAIIEQDAINVSKITCVESSGYMLETFNRLIDGLELPFSIETIKEDFLSYTGGKSFDIVLTSFAINEINKKDRISFLDKMWNLSNKYILIIEPGTPTAHKEMMEYKKHFISKGGKIVAPCAIDKCPLIDGDDWCHFQVRLNRPSIQSKIKGGVRNFEDEKFTFLLISKEDCEKNKEENVKILIRKPIIQKGNISLTFCEKQGINRKIYTKKDGEKYKKAKKLDVGDFMWVYT